MFWIDEVEFWQILEKKLNMKFDYYLYIIDFWVKVIFL